MKKLLKGFAAILISALVCAAPLGSCGDEVDVLKSGASSDYLKTVKNDLYEYDVFDGYIAIVKYNGAEKEVRIPSEIDGKPVKSISANSFYNCDKAVKTVVIPASIETIEDNSFTGNKIERFEIDNGNLNYIEKDGAILDKAETKLVAYACGSDREEFSIPDAVERIPSGVFSGARGLKRLEIPESVKEIDTFALMNSGLTELRLTAVEKLGMGALWNCLDLVELELPRCLKEISIPASICQNCSSLRTVKGYDSTEAAGLINAEGVNAEYISLGQ